MSFLEKIKSNAKNEIIKGDLNASLDIFYKFISEYQIKNSEFENHFILISGTYLANKQRWRDGIISFNDWELLENRLRSNCLQLIADLDSLTEEKIVKKIVTDDNSSVNTGLVSPDFGYSPKWLFFTIEQMIKADDKISNLEVKIENKKVEITKTSSKNKVNSLNLQIDRLKQELETEKMSYKELELRHRKLEKEYDEHQKGKNKYDDLMVKTVDDNNPTYLAILEKISNVSDKYQLIIEQFEQSKINNEKRRNEELNNISSIMLYLDDLNRKIDKILKNTGR